MRAYREANTVTGVNVLTSNEFSAITAVNRDSSTLYVIGTVASGNVTISDVYVGNVRQNFLVDNTGALVWVGKLIIQHRLHLLLQDLQMQLFH